MALARAADSGHIELLEGEEIKVTAGWRCGQVGAFLCGHAASRQTVPISSVSVGRVVGEDSALVPRMVVSS